MNKKVPETEAGDSEIVTKKSIVCLSRTQMFSVRDGNYLTRQWTELRPVLPASGQLSCPIPAMQCQPLVPKKRETTKKMATFCLRRVCYSNMKEMGLFSDALVLPLAFC